MEKYFKTFLNQQKFVLIILKEIKKIKINSNLKLNFYLRLQVSKIILPISPQMSFFQC